jgi:hypothetical protein
VVSTYNSLPPVVQGLEFDWASFAWPMAAGLLCAPVVFPWYLLWLLPFLAFGSTPLIVIAVWSISIIPVYVQWHARTLSGVWGPLPVWVMLVEYGCVTIAAAMAATRRKRGAQFSRE